MIAKAIAPDPATEINEPYAAGPGPREPVDFREGEVHEHLGLGAGHEDPRPDVEGQRAEVGPSGEVLERDAAGALGEHSGIRLLERGWEGTPDDHEPTDVGGLRAEHVRGELHRVDVG